MYLLYYECNLGILNSPCCPYDKGNMKYFQITFILHSLSRDIRALSHNLPASDAHPFTNPLPWPHGIVECPSYVHFRISPRIGHFVYVFMSTVNSDILLLSHVV